MGSQDVHRGDDYMKYNEFIPKDWATTEIRTREEFADAFNRWVVHRRQFLGSTARFSSSVAAAHESKQWARGWAEVFKGET